MKRHAIIAAVLLTIGCGSAPKVTVVPEQAAPVDDYWRALQTDDVALFRTVWSQDRREDFSGDWQATFDGYQNLDNLWRALGAKDVPEDWLTRLDRSKLRYGYVGDGNGGYVVVDDGTGALHHIDVIREADGWKIDEN